MAAPGTGALVCLATHPDAGWQPAGSPRGRLPKGDTICEFFNRSFASFCEFLRVFPFHRVSFAMCLQRLSPAPPTGVEALIKMSKNPVEGIKPSTAATRADRFEGGLGGADHAGNRPLPSSTVAGDRRAKMSRYRPTLRSSHMKSFCQ